MTWYLGNATLLSGAMRDQTPAHFPCWKSAHEPTESQEPPTPRLWVTQQARQAPEDALHRLLLDLAGLGKWQESMIPQVFSILNNSIQSCDAGFRKPSQILSPGAMCALPAASSCNLKCSISLTPAQIHRSIPKAAEMLCQGLQPALPLHSHINRATLPNSNLL